jgi:hypothetical protein
MNNAKWWQDEIGRERSQMLRLLNGEGEGEGVEYLVQSSVRLEKFVWVTAYLCRKLKEACALTQEVVDREWPVKRFPVVAIPPHVHWFTITEDLKTFRQPLEQYYDLAHPEDKKLEFPTLCNYLIHHFAFELRLAADNRVEILFNSDHSKHKGLYLITLDEYMSLLQEVQYDETRWISASRHDGTVTRRRSRPAD